ncbi:MAG: hypothetical protein AAFX06_21760 [Planctomycetota bacterium]
MIVVNNRVFDLSQGTVLLPEADGVPFRSQSLPGVGIQVTQQRSPGFTLTLTRYAAANQLSTERVFTRLSIGQRVRVTEYVNNAPIDYFGAGYMFAITQARIVRWQAIPAWHGYRLNNTKISYTPALRLVSQWTMYAVQV